MATIAMVKDYALLLLTVWSFVLTLQLLRPLDNCPIYTKLQDSDMHTNPEYIAAEEKYKVLIFIPVAYISHFRRDRPTF